jgi:hypothetical protein
MILHMFSISRCGTTIDSHHLRVPFEGIYGFAPPHTTKSEKDYTLYFASTMVWMRHKDGTFVKASIKDILLHKVQFLGFLFLAGLYQSWLSTYVDWCPFGAPASRREWYGLDRVVSLEQWGNNFCVAGKLRWMHVMSKYASETIYNSNQL